MIVEEKRFDLQFPGGCRSWPYRALIVGQKCGCKSLCLQQIATAFNKRPATCSNINHLRTTNFNRLQLRSRIWFVARVGGSNLSPRPFISSDLQPSGENQTRPIGLCPSALAS